MNYRMIVIVLLSLGLLRATAGEQPASYLARGLGADGKTETRTAVRTFKPTAGAGPAIVLVGVAHLGEASYFEAVQARLDACDLVLYEGVGRPLFMIETAGQTKSPAAWTRSAVAYLADLVVWYRDEIGSMPDSFRKLRLAVKLHNPKELAWLDRVKMDPQGRTIQLNATDGACSIQYLKDGQAEESNTPLQAVVTTETRASTAGSLQKQLADALGLTFQLNAIDYSNPKFVNSDLSLSQLRARMRGDADPVTTETEPETAPDSLPDNQSTLPGPDDNELETLIKRMQGDDPAIQLIMTMFKGILTQSEQGRELVKWILGEALVNAEGLMDGLSRSKTGTLAGTAELMQVLIHDRNAVVMNDLRQALKDQPGLKAIAIFYGAAHMPDFQDKLINELKYSLAESEWLTVFAADREKAGISAEQANELRRTIKEQMKSLE